ncbi:MAG: hypothetical protein C0469_04690 [Cyanobacteria bacterium DS2.3.42]|nr:hypothetical protein [Cyanobacteria bacterium DS2.3.42]
MAEAAQPYDSTRGPVKEAAADAASIRTTLEKDGSDAAVTRLRSEVESVPERDRQTYNQALLKSLQGDARMPNILPEMAIAFGIQNSGSIMGSSFKWGSEKVVDADKISTAASRESNPIYQELYREMGNKYRNLRADNGQNTSLFDSTAQRFTIGQVHVPESQLRKELATEGVRVEQRRQFGVLAANPKLFDGIASGGEITPDSVSSFKDKWDQTGTAGADFRKQYAPTIEQQRQISQTLDNLKFAFDEERNKDNKPGSVLKDNITGWFARNVTEVASSYGKMTRESLLSGLGYRSMEEARLRLPADAGGKPIADVTSLSSYDNTKLLNAKDGPRGVATRMLSGQEQFFKDETGGVSKAITDLTTALGVKAGNHDERAVNQVRPENRDKVIQAIQETGNTRLRDWFVSRYPADMASVAASAAAAGPLENSSTKVVPKQGPDAVATNMLKDAGLDASARQALSQVLHKDIGVNWKSVRSGTALITTDNLEDVRTKIAAKGNSKLIEWFDTKYPKR